MGFFLNNNYPSKIKILIDSYAPKLIILALATANNFRNNSLNDREFINLCNDYLGIKDPVSDPLFMDKESHEIVESLKNRKEKIIPDHYIQQEIIREICSYYLIFRLARQQYETFLFSLNEFYMLYDVLLRLNKNTNGSLGVQFEKNFEIDYLHFLRAVFGIFTLGLNKKYNGKIFFQGLICEEVVKDKFEIDIDICKSVAMKIAYSESLLRENWYKKEVLTKPELYQKYYPTPLYKSPIISTDLTKEIDCLIPSPSLYIRAIIDSVFSRVLPSDKIFSTKLGYAIQEHIYVSLSAIFGKERVSKIPESKCSRSADFLIDLDNCYLIIECKESIGGPYSELSIMSPKGTAEIWSRLYNASEQCAASINMIGSSTKPIISMVLIADNIIAESIPFDCFATRTNLYSDMGLDYIEFISWNSFQYGLSKTSINKFVEKLLERKNKHDATIKDMIFFSLEKDKPAHNYEYFKDAEYDIFGKNF